MKFDLRNNRIEDAKLRSEAATELTIAAGVVTATLGVHRIDTEADAAADDLDTISGLSNGDSVILYLENSARVVTLRHLTGNIKTSNGVNVAMSANGYVTLVSDGTNLRLEDGSGVATGEANTASNVGAGIGVFKQKTGVNLEFKSLTEGANNGVAIVSNPSDVSLEMDIASIATGTTTFSHAAVRTSGGVTATITKANMQAEILDNKVRVSTNDTIADFLFNKMAAGNAITLTIANPSASEDVQIDATRTGVFREMWVPASAMTPRATAGAAAGTIATATNGLSFDSLDFDGATTNEAAHFTLQGPRAWAVGSASTFRFIAVWTPASGSAGTEAAVWGMRATSITNATNIDQAFGTQVLVTDTLAASTNLRNASPSGNVTIGNTPSNNDFIVFEIERVQNHANDNLAQDARLLGVMLQYQENATEPTQI